MNRKTLLLLMVTLTLVGFYVAKKIVNHDSKEKIKISESQGLPYWTCPMHPQIHSEKTGECPICHMALVQIQNRAQKQNINVNQTDSRAEVMASAHQVDLMGIQKHKVEKMSLTANIPVSGRLISSVSIAFQVYESDLKYVKSGLSFKGESGLFPESEINGIITSVDSVIDPSSRTVRVIGTIQKAPRGLISESSFSGIIKYELKDRVAIPESAVLHTGSDDLVYLMDDSGKLTAQKVILGLKAESFYEVISGLTSGDIISSGPNFLIDSEAKIRGASKPIEGQPKSENPSCPQDQHWDNPMAMCMPGKASK